MKIAFVANGEPPDRLLSMFKRYTPQNKGIWGQLEGVDNYKDAQVFGVVDYLPPNLGINEAQCVFLGAHPPSMQSYKDMSQYRGIKSYDCAKEFGFGEIWLDFTYDQLMEMNPPAKTKKLGAIVSNADTQFYHKKRIEWLKRFTDTNPQDFDLYGRIIPSTESMKRYYRGICGSWDARGAVSANGNNHMVGKEQVILSTQFLVEFDAFNENHYFGERVFDCLLGWASPIYWGCTNLHKYLPKECFSYLDIDGDGKDVKDIISSNLYESKLPFIKEARMVLLNELQLWPRIHKGIWGVCK